MSFNGSGTFNINSAGQPVVSGTVISSSTFNTLTADLATGLSTCITKDGQTTVTANIPLNGYKITGLGAGTAATDAARVGQLQAGAASVVTAAGTDTYTGTMSPSLGAYAAGNTFTFVVPNTNTTAATLNIDGLGAKALTRDGSTALVAGDLVANAEIVVVYDGTRFQVLNSNSKTNFNLSGTLTVAGNTTLSGGTANGVAYLNASKVLTTGSALTWDGSTFYVKPAGAQFVTGATFAKIENLSGASASFIMADTTDSATIKNVASSIAFINSSTEGMRLTSTGLGIGTSSPTNKLQVNGAVYAQGDGSSVGYYLNAGGAIRTAGIGALYIDTATTTGTEIVFRPATVERMRLDTSGNLGLGVTPAAWNASSMQIAGNIGFTVAGNFTANAYYNGTFKYTTSGSLASTYQQASGIHTWSTAPSGTAGNTITFTEAMRLDASGNLGLGVTPSAWSGLPANGVLQMYGGSLYTPPTGGQDTIGMVSNAYYNGTNWIYKATSNATSYEQYAGVHRWFNAPSGTAGNAITFTQAMTLDASGNLLVGATSAGFLNVWSCALRANGNGDLLVNHPSGAPSGTAYAQFGYNGAGIGSITQSGTAAVLYNVTSDRRLKDNITDADSASDLIDAIKVRQFDWKSDGSHQRYGMIAQELHKVAPEAVHSPADPDDMMAVDYSKLVPMLVKEIQSLRVRLNALENK